MLSHATLEGLLASISAAIVMSVKQTVSNGLNKTLETVMTEGKKVAGDTVQDIGKGKLKMTAPVIVGAVIIGAAVIHGAWRGKRKHEQRSFVEAEDERRADRENQYRATA